jgi:hypothetical protein
VERLSEEQLVEQYRDWQEALASLGETPYTATLFVKLAPKIDGMPWDPGFQTELERLHRLAFPDPATRPPRYTVEVSNPIE